MLANRAKAGGVDLWALTDHDEVSGQLQALSAAHAIGLDYLTGVEISVTFLGETIHIVGLGFDPAHPTLLQGLETTRSGRDQRGRAIANDLARVGIMNAYEGALKFVGNPALISRTHFARYLVEAGVCANTHEVFRRFLTEGRPGYVAHRWAKLGDAVQWIVQAGGAAIIAHPARYQLSPTEEYALFTEFKQHGGEGVEVVTGSHTVAEYHEYAQIAREFDLFASCGSDFHGPDESRMDLGMLPPLPKGLTPIWERLSHRILHST